MAEATVVVADVQTKSGESQSGRAWTMWKLIDGNGDDYVTFSSTVGQTLGGFKGKKALVTFSEDDKGKKLDSITEAPAEKPSGRMDDPVTQRRITVLAAMKVAADIVNHAADQAGEPVKAEQRIPAVKRFASELASWADEWSRRDPDDIPFSED